MDRTSLRSTEFPVLSQSGAGSEAPSPRSAKSLRKRVRALDHLFGSGCGRAAAALPNVASRFQASMLHAQSIRNSASFSERSPGTILPSSSFNEGRDRCAVDVFEAVVSRGQRLRRLVCSGAFVSRVQRSRIRSASSDAARRSFSQGWAEAVEAPDKVGGAGSVALRESPGAFQQRDPECRGPLSDRRLERKRRKEGPAVQHSACNGRLSYTHERQGPTMAVASSNIVGLGPGAAEAQKRCTSGKES
jgi:hypothetical protein